MARKKLFRSAGLFFFFWFILFSSSPAFEKSSISFEIAPEAQLLNITYYLKVLKEFGGGKPALHFEIKIRNLASRAERFSVMVTAPDGASAAGFIPAKAKKAGGVPALEPKEEGSVTLPLLTEGMTGPFSLTVETAQVQE
jgi:hypothetical protein